MNKWQLAIETLKSFLIKLARQAYAHTTLPYRYNKGNLSKKKISLRNSFHSWDPLFVSLIEYV